MPVSEPTTRSFYRLQKALLFILATALLGTGAELLLVGHYEDPWQWVPLILISLALLLLAPLAMLRRAAIVRAWQALMILFLLGGATGLALHWKGKMEFKSESDPSLTGLKLFWESLHSESPPPLAPGVMIQMGLLGLACAYRHPALEPRSGDSLNDKGEPQ
jgi:hypothetical protein